VRDLATACLLSLALLLGGCGTLPAREPLPVTHALAPAEVATTTLARLAAVSTPAEAQGLSGFRLLPTGEYAFEARTALAEAAQRSIDAQYYHVHDDSAGVAFLRGLRDAARRGVRVRLLVDDYHAGEVFNLLIALNAEPGAEVRLFNPLLIRSGSPLVRLLASAQEFERAHRRMHNKLFVADNAVAVFGGRNIADEYFWRHGQANFIDLDVLAIGPVVPALSLAFDAYWNSDLAWRADRVPGAGRSAVYEQRLFERRAAELPLTMTVAPTDPLGQTPVGAQLHSGILQLRWGPATVHADAPSKVTDPVVLYQPTPAMRAKLQIIGQARDEVIIVSPYFVPEDVGMQMMAEAARKAVRGIVFTNSLGSTDEPLVHRAYSRYRREMLQLGLQLYEMKPVQPARGGDFGDFGSSIGRLHVKGAAVDRRWLLVGSVNLDGRSAVLNTEMAVSIDCPPLVADALAALGREPWRSMYRVALAEGARTLQWREIDADGRVLVHTEEPGDSAWWRAWHRFQSLFVEDVML
jgi:putative cardiolipin synthase